MARAVLLDVLALLLACCAACAGSSPTLLRLAQTAAVQLTGYSELPDTTNHPAAAAHQPSEHVELADPSDLAPRAELLRQTRRGSRWLTEYNELLDTDDASPGRLLLRQAQPTSRRLTEYIELTNTTELPVLRAIDASCGRLIVIWCAVKKAGEGASVSDSYLKVSVLSVLAKAPSVVPVLLFDGPPEHPLAAWVRDKGVTVLVHALSFKEPMMAAATELYRWQTTTWLATFSYFDIGLVADELRNRTQGMGVDLASVLYTDVDTIFMGDMNACSLPAPRILAAAGEVTMLTPANAGVLHLNLSAWQALHGDLMRFAGAHNWTFPNADQEWLFSFFGDRVSVLPDTYNWKPYWGHPKAGTWGTAPAVKILHIHGPKFQESTCVLKFLDTYNLVDDSNSTLLAQIKGWCKYDRSQYSMQLLLDANRVDGGRMYSEAHAMFYHYLAKARILGRPDEGTSSQ